MPRAELEKAPHGADLYVIELDVEPGSDWCESLKFKLNVRREGAKGKRKKGCRDTDDWREFTYFFRDGSQTISFKESDKAGLKRIEKAIVARKHHEEMKVASLMDPDTSKRLMSILSLKRSSGFPNETIRYVLLLNDLDVPASSLEWVASMEWFLILDFTDDSLSEPLKALRDNNIRLIPTIGIDELAKLKNDGVNEYLYSICGTSTTLHINCVPKNGEEDNWQQSGGLGLTKLISLASNFDHAAMSDVVLITLLGSHRKLQYIAETIKEFSKVLPVTHMACLHENPKNAQVILQQVEPFFGHLWREQAFCVNFKHLNNVLLKIMGQENESEHLLPCSFGVNGIPKKSLDYFRKGGITIVPSDVCSDVNNLDDSVDTDAFVEKCEKDIEKYLKGTITPPWILYHVADNMRNPGLVNNRLTKGLVYRDITDVILSEVKKLEAGTENIVVRLPIVHMPSAGATTIARHVLWCLKDDRRCAIIDGNHYRDEMAKLQEVADSILNFRALGENDDKVVQGTQPQLTCPTIIVLFDNCHQQMAKALTKYVEKNCEKKGIVSKSPILVIMCLYSMFKYQPESVDQFDVENRNLHWIDRRLSIAERKRFTDKLEEIQNKRTTVEDLLSFVILAYANEEDSEFVRHVVNKTLTDMNEREKGLLLYLSVLKYYSNGWLPNQLVLNFTYGQIMAEASIVQVKQKNERTLTNITQVHRNMSPQFESLVTIDDTMPNDSGGGSFWLKKNFVSISHASVAYNILKALVPRNKLANTVKEMLSEKAIMDASCQREQVHKVFRLLLTQRTINEKTHMKDSLSKVCIKQ